MQPREGSSDAACASYLSDRVIKQLAFHTGDEGHQPSETAQRSPALLKLDEIPVHLSPKRDASESRPISQEQGNVVPFPKVGGLHHHYERIAA
ncbi:MAG: hypothetical protein ACRBM6_29450 [Geminicoccales bacterium]